MDISRIFLNKDKTPNFKSTICFNYYRFIDIFMGELKDLDKNFEWLRKTVDGSFNSNRGSISTRFSNIYGQEFVFSIYGKDLYLWDHSGGTASGNVQLDDNLKIRKNQLNNIVRLTENFTNGIIECNLCDKEINYQENRNHRYVAGIYCSECWESKIREIEAKENYE